jgi:hypothetical protein
MNVQTIEQMAADAISAVWLARSYEDASRNDGGSCARGYRQLAKMEYANVVALADRIIALRAKELA